MQNRRAYATRAFAAYFAREAAGRPRSMQDTAQQLRDYTACEAALCALRAEQRDAVRAIYTVRNNTAHKIAGAVCRYALTKAHADPSTVYRWLQIARALFFACREQPPPKTK